jgi:hypothetical protein
MSELAGMERRWCLEKCKAKARVEGGWKNLRGGFLGLSLQKYTDEKRD